ncbi:MAG: glycosyltransferase, partial [Rhodospirillales bacterium]|nr:glycosyltransferase [Rhodospirillales bacterium]
VTLSALARGDTPPYIAPRGLRDFDLVLSYAGGSALTELQARLGARRVRPLYGHVDPDVHRPASPRPDYACALSHIGTYAPDRHDALVELFVKPARDRPRERFVLAGSLYPADFPWTDNLFVLGHLAPQDHAAFYASSRLTLNVTRRAMAEMGWCPSGRLFEAAACGSAMLSDWWAGLDRFFEPGREILIARSANDVIEALDRDDGEIRHIADAARERVLTDHTSIRRAAEFEIFLDEARSPADGASAPLLTQRG